MRKTNMALLENPFRKLLTELVSSAEFEADIQGLNGSEKDVFVVEYIKGFTIEEDIYLKCPTCKSTSVRESVTEAPGNWICLDCRTQWIIE
ncbi:hypothetical protein [Vibrio sp.]|uniref:hypothetical protein n=1 Tax=Vibrio sp. TaxID=678 RepID=UPI003F6B33F0